MDVAADEYRVCQSAGGDRIQEPLARSRIAVPAVGPEADLVIPRLLPQLRHQLALRQPVPSGFAPLEALKQPVFLLGAEQRALRLETFATAGDVAPTRRRCLAWLLGAVLAAVEHGKR